MAHGILFHQFACYVAGLLLPLFTFCFDVLSRLEQQTNKEVTTDFTVENNYRPDDTTYRILLKAYNSRFMAYSESIKLFALE